MSLRNQLRIMVVDDMSTSRGLITQALDDFGIRQVESATDGHAALKKIATWPVHLVISDMNMPGMNGLQLLHALRNAPATRKVGFLLITGKVERDIIEMGKKLGMNNFIPKPFRPDDLRNAVEAIVGRL
ncbi:response regulator [Maritimibacter dapengensis]|uniref:Response regulator n=1 Tax=Maritimibacter dapengensis TaxID=2836868 RepID=A0ABS6T2F0_9RHOB|nr:response regulator [Maritimibacter dapengensis]MBV7379418.1 response regulator [Maritimibacter dapengensis]